MNQASQTLRGSFFSPLISPPCRDHTTCGAISLLSYVCPSDVRPYASLVMLLMIIFRNPIHCFGLPDYNTVNRLIFNLVV